MLQMWGLYKNPLLQTEIGDIVSYSLDQIRHEPAKIRIGKKGLTEGIINEVNNLLKKNVFLKIKCLKTIPKESINPIAVNIAKITKSEVVEVRGKTFILKKE